MKHLGLLITVILLSSCGATVGIDYDENTDFSEFTTYQFYPSIESGLNQLDDKRIMAAIDSTLQQRGFIKTDNNKFLINFYVSESVSEARNTLGIGIGSGGGNVGVGVSGGIPIGGTVLKQQLTIDIVEASGEGSLVWQAVIEGEVKERASPQQKEEYYRSVIGKALKKFPPKNK